MIFVVSYLEFIQATKQVLCFLYIFQKVQKIPRIELLIVEKDFKSHYVWIRDFNKLTHSQRKHVRRKYFCKFFMSN